MKTTVNIKKLFKISLLFVSAIIASFSFSSCDFEYDIIEQGSIADLTPPKAGFSATQATSAGAEDWKIFTFSNESSSATEFMWDFGDGNTSTEKDPTNIFPGEDTYTVKLVASDKLGAKSTFTKEVKVVEPIIPISITPEIINGDFDLKFTGWQISSFSDGNTRSPFNSSSDGNPVNYDGTDSGSSKTPGAKWTGSTSAGPSKSKSTRYAYQAITVTPNVEYVIEYSYAIKTDKADITGGDRVIVEILDGFYSDGVAAIAASDAGPIVQAIGNDAKGKGVFTIVKEKFTSTATGELSIWIYAITNDELYVDNVKVYPNK